MQLPLPIRYCPQHIDRSYNCNKLYATRNYSWNFPVSTVCFLHCTVPRSCLGGICPVLVGSLCAVAIACVLNVSISFWHQLVVHCTCQCCCVQQVSNTSSLMICTDLDHVLITQNSCSQELALLQHASLREHLSNMSCVLYRLCRSHISLTCSLHWRRLH